ncbi:MAG: hypothetical protein ACOC1F_12685 [Myxococcota bacterium]
MFDEVSERVRDRRFLVGDRFSTADLTFASLASLALGVQREEGYGAVMPPLEQCASDAQRVMRALRDTEAGRFVLRIPNVPRAPPLTQPRARACGDAISLATDVVEVRLDLRARSDRFTFLSALALSARRTHAPSAFGEMARIGYLRLLCRRWV